MIYRAKRIDNGELVEGSYHHSADNKYHYILNLEKFLDRPDGKVVLHKSEVHEIHPATLAMATGQPDKNGVMIFGSVPVDGIGMSKGGDVLTDTSLSKKNTFICFYGVLDTPSFGVANIETGKRDTVDSFGKYFTITGKQYEL